jgi:ribosome modulation factor
MTRQELEQVREQGYRAGIGEPPGPGNPYPYGSEANTWWLSGWCAGYAERRGWDRRAEACGAAVRLARRDEQGA